MRLMKAVVFGERVFHSSEVVEAINSFEVDSAYATARPIYLRRAEPVHSSADRISVLEPSGLSGSRYTCETTPLISSPNRCQPKFPIR
jgi:hypothetical protein